jgi:hypothetical protein
LEARLILLLLGPLAIASGLLEFTALLNQDSSQDLGDAFRNVCNSTLTLLYTSALLIWGLLLNRNRAWRTDGGTALFGVLAVSLALVGTAVNYLEVKEDRAKWLEGIVWCILVWQSWVGFWWWVGAGMYAGEVADREKKEAKQRAKEERKIARKKGQMSDSVAKRLKRRVHLRGDDEADLAHSQSTTRLTVTDTSMRRRHGGNAPEGQTADESYELDDMRPGQTGVSAARSESSRSQESRLGAIASFFMKPQFMGALRHLRAAHDEAARDRAQEDATKKRGLRRWGLGGFKHETPVPGAPGDAESTTDETASVWGNSSNSGSLAASTFVGTHDGQELASVSGGATGSGRPPTPTVPPPVATSSSPPSPLPRSERPDEIVTIEETGFEGRGMDENSGAWWWRGPWRKARLRDVTTYK